MDVKVEKIKNLKKIRNIIDIFDLNNKKNTLTNFGVNEKLYDENYCRKEARRIFEAMTIIPHGVFKYLIILILKYGSTAYKELNIKYYDPQNRWGDK